MAFSAANFTTDRLSKVISQMAHGFSVGHIVVFDGATGNYILALADTFIDSAGSMMVSYVYDANTFAVTQDGFVFNIAIGAPFTVTDIYWLSTGSPGEMQTSAPVVSGQVNLPCFIPVTTTSGYFWGGMGTVVGSGGGGGGGLTWQTISASQTLVPNNGYYVNHGSSINLLLPPVITIQQSIQIIGIGVGGFEITQSNSPNQQTLCGTSMTTLGSAGSIQSTTQGDCVTINCYVANTNFVCNPGNAVLIVT